jgi:hypothetical protein
MLYVMNITYLHGHRKLRGMLYPGHQAVRECECENLPYWYAILAYNLSQPLAIRLDSLTILYLSLVLIKSGPWFYKNNEVHNILYYSMYRAYCIHTYVCMYIHTWTKLGNPKIVHNVTYYVCVCTYIKMHLHTVCMYIVWFVL